MTVFITKRVALVFFSYFILSCALYAQTSQVGTPSNVEPLPQVFTPNAAELGKYGKVPVSYFNGLPNITIPLTELKGKNYDLPVYLTYHAGGIKPDEHAGPVGLGWSLHAGGCINRIVNGLKDEEDGAELAFFKQTHDYGPRPSVIVEPEHPPIDLFPVDGSIGGPGLFYNWGLYHNTDWSSSFHLDNFARNDEPQDYEPDEFIVNIEGLSASFYFDGDNGIRIVSQTAEEFSVTYELSTYGPFAAEEVYLLDEPLSYLKAHHFTYIKKLILTRGDGTRYIFGGDMSSIEFCYQQDKRLSDQRLVGTASTWYLTKIELPGRENLNFTYEKHGFPIVKKDVHSKLYVHYNDFRDTVVLNYSEEVYTSESDYSNLSLTILHPSYLTRIENTMSGDWLDFVNYQTDELESDVSHDEFVAIMGGMTGLDIDSFISEQNYHMGVGAINSPTKRIRLDYRGLEYQAIPGPPVIDPNNSVIMPPDAPAMKDRLRLDRIIIGSKTYSDDPGMEYRFNYDTQTLPHSYNSKFTDHWGYYTALRYNDILKNRTSESDLFYRTTLNSLMDQYRAPNAYKMQAEILKEIVYPTGGYTKFEYEPHYYHRIASCFNPETQRFDFSVRYSPGMAGGLRIKSITDSLTTGKVEKRVFSYNNSGILSGKPLYGAVGRTILTTSNYDVGLFGERYLLYTGFTDVTYRMGSEHLINQLSPTSGNHVTYGSVTETFADNSSVTYYYSDHLTVPDSAPLWTESNINCSLLLDPVTSMQLGRGLLLQVDYRDAQSNLVRRETMTYKQPSATEYLLAISKRNPAPSGSLKRVSVNRIAYYHPCLLSKTVTTWPEESAAPITETETYTYNDHRRIIDHTRTRGNDSESERILYAEDISQGIYPTMTSAGYGGMVIEKMALRNGTLTGASLTTWRRDSTILYMHYVPDEVFRAELESPLPINQWSPFSGTSHSSLYGAPELSFLTYDSHRNITHVKTHSGRHSYYLWDEKGMNLNLITNAPEVMYQDFESSLSAVEGGYLSEKAKSGVVSLSFSCPNGVPYVVDYRKKTGSVWIYNRSAYTGPGMQIGSEGALVDNIRIYPEGSQIETYTYNSPGLLRSITDARGLSRSFTYDWDRRLKGTYDNDGNQETTYQYHYRNNERDSTYAQTAPYAGANVMAITTYLDAGGLSPYNEESWYDDFGRISLSKKKGASTFGNDIVQEFEYDDKGRLSKEWIPRSSVSFPPHIDEVLYSETVYDSSPLDRTKKKFGPGADWRIGNHSVRYTYLSNTLQSNSARFCRRYSVSFAQDGTAVINKSGFWPAGTLEVLKVTNEDGAESYSYKDMWGQEILRREEGLDTYYVYDDLGRLTAVFPPTLSDSLKIAIGTITESECPEISDYAYLYRYDSRGRCIAKRLPGCEWTFYVYDDADRPVFEQDGNDRAAGRWKFVFTDSQDRECLKGTVSNLTLDPFANPLNGLTLDVSRSYPLANAGMYGYTLTGLTLSNPEMLVVNWWDDYSFLGKWSVPAANSLSVMYLQPDLGSPYGLRYNPSAAGLNTGTLTKVLGNNVGNQYLWSVSYYDKKGRIVQSKNNHLLGRMFSSRYGYDFAGHLTARENTYTLSGDILMETYTYSYDNCGRPLQTSHKLGGSIPVVLKNIGYDSVGLVHSDNRTGNPALNTTYSYNDRDWLTSLKVGVNGGTFSEDLSYQSSADTLFTPRWGGDIALQEWSVGSQTDTSTHKYRFVYDSHSRLLDADYSSNDSTFRFSRHYTYDNEGNLLTSNSAMSEKTFIYQGNLLQRISEIATYIDIGGDFLVPDPEVIEPGPDPVPNPNPDPNPKDPVIFDPVHPDPLIPDPVIEPSIEPEGTVPYYTYDAVGNMTYAKLEGINSVTYNILNLPQQVELSGLLTQTVCFQYGADGTKLSRTLNPTQYVQGVPRTYIGPLIMEGETPSILLVDGGYITFQLVAGHVVGTYHFYVTDHQGNIRAIVDENGSIEKYYHYDPYGEVAYESLSSGPVNNYKYSGKEWDDKQKAYDFSARMYMPGIARFTTMDPLCEKDPGHSPYLYCAGNPVNLVDPDGNQIIPWALLYKELSRLLETDGNSHNIKTAGYVMQHPFIAAKIGMPKWANGSISNVSSNYSINLSRKLGMSGMEGSGQNALRHTIWQAMITQKYGVNHAQRVAAAHEDVKVDVKNRLFSTSLEADTAADMLNNPIGQKIGSVAKGDNGELVNEVLKIFHSEGLWIVTKLDDNTYHLDRKQLSYDELLQAQEYLKILKNNGLQK